MNNFHGRQSASGRRRRAILQVNFAVVFALVFALFLPMTSVIGEQDSSPARPNFLLIVTDDQGYGDVGCYGASDLATPAIDALAAAGVRLTNWYANAPVCAPTRASLMTGRYPWRAGVPALLGVRSEGLPLDQITLPQALQSVGYRTGLVGKWHLGGADAYRPNRRGFDEFFGHVEGCIDYFTHLIIWNRVKQPLHDLWRNDQEIWENGHYMTHLITREASRFLRAQDESPFFLYVAYNAPHYPLHAPAEYFQRFVHLPKQRQSQAAMIAAVDDSIGEILALVDELGMAENTVVVFQSDNGPSNERRNFLSGETDPMYLGGSSAPFRGYKGGLLEGGVRVPACVRWPGQIPAGSVVDGMAASMDLWPTFANLAGVPLPSEYSLDGRDVLPMLQGSGASPHGSLSWTYRGQQAVRHGKWKLILHGKSDFQRDLSSPLWLSDLNADPGETTNLADAQPGVVAELQELLAADLELLPSPKK